MTFKLSSSAIVLYKFCKFAFGVSTNALNLAIYVSLVVSLFQYIEGLNDQILAKIITTGNDKLPIYLKEAYFLAKNQKVSW